MTQSPDKTIRIFGWLAAFLIILFVAYPASSAAWIFDEQCASTSAETNLHQYTPPKALIMLDRSGSMGSDVTTDLTRWEAARAAIEDVVGEMTRSGACDSENYLGCDRIRFGLGLFWYDYNNDTARTPIPNPIAEDNLSPILSTIDSHSPGGGTPTGAAAQTLANSSSLDDTEHETTALMVTDGIPTSGAVEAVDQICQMRNRDTSPADTFIVGFSSGTNTDYNGLLAASGGTGHCCPAGEPDCGATQYIDPCAADSSTRSNYVEDALTGSSDALECSGHLQADDASQLRQSLYKVVEEIACTFELDFPEETYTTGQAYEDPTATSVRMYHRQFGWIDIPHQSKDTLDDELMSKGVADATASQYEGEGWRFKHADARETIVFTRELCGDILSGETETVETQLACDCPKTGESCQVENREGVCAEGRYICDIPPGENVCQPIYDSTDTIGTECQVPGETGRCASGVKVCSSGEEKCKQIRRSMPEICNGLDDDCNGLVDDIHSSWNRRHSSTLQTSNSSLTCGGVTSCACPPGGADSAHRGYGSSLEEEFKDMVSKTQTSCRCRPQ